MKSAMEYLWGVGVFQLSGGGRDTSTQVGPETSFSLLLAQMWMARWITSALRQNFGTLRPEDDVPGRLTKGAVRTENQMLPLPQRPDTLTSKSKLVTAACVRRAEGFRAIEKMELSGELVRTDNGTYRLNPDFGADHHAD